MSDLGGALDPTRDLCQLQMLNLSVENLGGTSDGLCSWPSQWFLPVSVREGNAFETVQRVYGWTSTSAGANHLSNKILAPWKSEGNSVQAEGCGVPVDGAFRCGGGSFSDPLKFGSYIAPTISATSAKQDKGIVNTNTSGIKLSRGKSLLQVESTATRCKAPFSRGFMEMMLRA